MNRRATVRHMNRFALLLLMLPLMLLASCRHQVSPQIDLQPGASTYIVRSGDTLYSIAKAAGVDYKQLARRNQIAPPYNIYVGQRLYLDRRAPLANSIPIAKSRGRDVPPTPSKPSGPSRPARVEQKLIWPVTGNISSPFGQRGEKPHDGIDILAAEGAPIFAAADGEVVYADQRLAGYGLLIIIRHDNDLFTVYGHNQRNLVERGAKVRAGEIVARVGQTGHATTPHLHFEVRIGQTPVDPLEYLPRR